MAMTEKERQARFYARHPEKKREVEVLRMRAYRERARRLDHHLAAVTTTDPNPHQEGTR